MPALESVVNARMSPTHWPSVKGASSRFHGSRAGAGNCRRESWTRCALFGTAECRFGSRQAGHEHSGEGPGRLKGVPCQNLSHTR